MPLMMCLVKVEKTKRPVKPVRTWGNYFFWGGKLPSWFQILKEHKSEEFWEVGTFELSIWIAENWDRLHWVCIILRSIELPSKNGGWIISFIAIDADKSNSIQRAPALSWLVENHGVLVSLVKHHGEQILQRGLPAICWIKIIVLLAVQDIFFSWIDSLLHLAKNIFMQRFEILFESL